MERRTPLSTTDAIIEYTTEQGKTGIVLITRGHEPYRGRLAIPGGFHEEGLTLEENAMKEAREETGLQLHIMNPRNPYTYSEAERDPRGHIVAHVYCGLGMGELRAGDDAAKADVYDQAQIRELLERHQRTGDVFAFDHARILAENWYRWYFRQDNGYA